MRKQLTLFLLIINFAVQAQNNLFPLKEYRSDLYKPTKINRLEELYLQGRVTQNTLPYFMTNYASDTIWGYFVVAKPLQIQNRNFHIIVNELGKITKSKMTPSDVECFQFYMQHDTVSFLSLKLSAKLWSQIERGKTATLLTQSLSDKNRDNSYKYKLAHEIWNDRLSLYRIYWNATLTKKTDFIVYRNELFLYSYEYFIEKGVLSSDISRESFYARSPLEWVKIINATFDIYYNGKHK